MVLKRDCDRETLCSIHFDTILFFRLNECECLLMAIIKKFFPVICGNLFNVRFSVILVGEIKSYITPVMMVESK